MNNRKKVLVIQRIAQPALDMLSARDDIEFEVLTDTSVDNIAARSVDVDAITIRDAPLPAEAIAGARNLKVVSRHGVGYDNVPIAFCTERGIPVTIIGDVNAVSVAEHTLFLMLAVAKNGGRFDRAVRAGDFAVRSRKTTVELRGKTLLLVGYGRIGQEFAAPRPRPRPVYHRLRSVRRSGAFHGCPLLRHAKSSPRAGRRGVTPRAARRPDPQPDRR